MSIELPNVVALAESIEAAGVEGGEWDEEWNGAEGEDGWDENDGVYEEDDGGLIIEDVAQRLRDGIWAELTKARAAVQPTTDAPTPSRTARREAALATMRTVLRILEANPTATATLSIPVPVLNGASILDLLHRATSVNAISRRTANTLGPVIVAALQAGAIIPTPTPLQAPLQVPMAAPQTLLVTETSKRKLDSASPDDRPAKRHVHEMPSQEKLRTVFEEQLARSIATVTQKLREKQGDPQLVLDGPTLEPHINRILRFATTGGPKEGPLVNDLAEVSGLLQVLSMVAGVSTMNHDNPSIPDGTIHRCSHDQCGKAFASPDQLQAHIRIHESSGDGENTISVPDIDEAISPDVLLRMQTLVRALRPVLQSSIGSVTESGWDPAHASQATLAQVLAQAQILSETATSPTS
jgi:hypothetical protein